MNVITSSRMKEGLKGIRNLFIWGVIFLILAIIGGVWAYFIHVKDVAPITMNSAIVNHSGPGVYASIEVASFPYAFAEQDDTTNKYYFVFDKEDLMYIAYLTDVQYNRLFDNATAENPIIISGMTTSIPEDVRKLAIEMYNQEYGEKFLTDENFNDYLGTIYLDTLSKPNDPTTQIILSIIFSGLAIGFFTGGIIKRKNILKKVQSFSEDDWKNMESELENNDTICYPTSSVYFSKNYIYNLKNGIDIFSYEDVLWMYPFFVKHYGITTSKSILLVTKDTIKHRIFEISGFSKKEKQDYEKIMNYIYDKNKNIVIGYTKENVQQMKDLYGIK